MNIKSREQAGTGSQGLEPEYQPEQEQETRDKKQGSGVRAKSKKRAEGRTGEAVVVERY